MRELFCLSAPNQKWKSFYNHPDLQQAFQKIAKAAIKQSASNNDGVDMGEVFGDNAGTIKLKSPSKSSGDDGCGC